MYDKITTDIRKCFEIENEGEDYYKPVRVDNFCNSSYLEYESNADRNKTLSIKECLKEIKPYLKDIKNLRKSDTQKIQLTIAINFICSRDTDNGRVIHSRSDNIELMINDRASDVIEELFQLLLSQYQIGLETSM